jgi:F0F1-type ATP synthase assembly protein I
MPEERRGRAAPWGLLVAGSEMVSFTLAGLVADYLLGTLPVFTVGLTLLGVPAAFFLLVRLSRPAPRPESQGGQKSQREPEA